MSHDPYPDDPNRDWESWQEFAWKALASAVLLASVIWYLTWVSR